MADMVDGGGQGMTGEPEALKHRRGLLLDRIGRAAGELRRRQRQ